MKWQILFSIVGAVAGVGLSLLLRNFLPTWSIVCNPVVTGIVGGIVGFSLSNK